MWGSDGSGTKDMPPSKLLAQAISDMWYYGEYWQYPWQDLGQPTPDMGNFDAWGHFSQVVWKGSDRCGCATQFCPAGSPMGGMDSWFTVCNYGGAGKSLRIRHIPPASADHRI
jgi:hypothetical protein